MNYDEWIVKMLSDGHLVYSERRKRVDSNMFPYKAAGPLTSKFANHLKKCYNEDTENKLTIDDWLYVCYISGITHPDDIGIALNKHHLSRIGDVGAYQIGTCRYILGADNLKERTINGGSKRGGDNRRGAANGLYGNTKYRGIGGALWSGYYHTPKGRFDTAQQAADANDISKISATRYCKHVTRSTKMSASEYKLFSDNLRTEGWWFEEVSK